VQVREYQPKLAQWACHCVIPKSTQEAYEKDPARHNRDPTQGGPEASAFGSSERCVKK
jgi:hypothetical protein